MKPTPKVMGYWFFTDEQEIIDKIINVSKAGKYKLIRDRNYTELSDEEAISWYHFVYDMLVKLGMVLFCKNIQQKSTIPVYYFVTIIILHQHYKTIKHEQTYGNNC